MTPILKRSYDQLFMNRIAKSFCRLLLIGLFLPVTFLGVEPLDLPDGMKQNPDQPEQDERLSANRKYYKAMDAARADYRGRLADILQHANRVELLLLDFEFVKEANSVAPTERFDVSPYQKVARILQTVKATPEMLVEARQHFQRLLKTRNDFGGGAFCHEPVHGVRFFKDDTLLFQTSLCWGCGNYFVTYPDDHDTATWVGMHDADLEAFFMSKVPIPEELLERFKKTHENKAK